MCVYIACYLYLLVVHQLCPLFQQETISGCTLCLIIVLICETYMFSPNKVLKELEIRYKWIDLRSYEDGIVPTTRKRDTDDACSKIIKVLRHDNNKLHLVIYPSTANPIYYKSHDIIVRL